MQLGPEMLAALPCLQLLLLLLLLRDGQLPESDIGVQATKRVLIFRFMASRTQKQYQTHYGWDQCSLSLSARSC
jgi:hypothetical protein